MPTFFHVDWLNSLTGGQSLMPMDVSMLPARELFPEGLSQFGNDILKAPAGHDVKEMELTLEVARRSISDGNDRPSRLASFFAFESLSDAIQYRSELRGGGDAPIWRVEACKSFRADMRFRNRRLRVSQSDAFLYWNQEQTETPLWEHLLTFPVHVVDRVDSCYVREKAWADYIDRWPASCQRILQKVLTDKPQMTRGVHGLGHWTRVYENGLRLSECLEINMRLIEAFALLHDSCRETDGDDDGHGNRAVAYVRELRSDYLDNLTDRDVQLLCEACAGHSDMRSHPNLTIQACWDADRLDIGRVGLAVDPAYLNTAPAKSDVTIQWARRRSHYRHNR